MRPIVPSFVDDGWWQAWLRDEPPDGPTTADAMSPGGFKAFEHRWALREAFELHQRIGKARVTGRTHELAAQLKAGLAAMSHVTLHTPASSELSAGIVCFQVEGRGPWEVVGRLRQRRILATVTPYAARHARLTPGVLNSPEEIEAALRAIRELG